MADKITKELYNGEIKIDFYPESHRYKLAGERTYLISATAATNIIDKSRFLIPWAVGLAGVFIRQYLENASGAQFTAEELYPVIEEALKQHQVKKEEAAGVGELIHRFAEEFAKAKIESRDIPDIEEADERVIKGICAFLDWYNANNITFLESEKIVYSKEHGFVGITDAVIELDGKKIILDYKSSKGIYSDQYYQLAAYWLAYEEENGKLDGAMILHFDKENGDFNIKEFSREDFEQNYPVFLHCLAIKKREKELAKY